MNADNLLHSEEDVKAKVISQWLVSHGFGPNEISLEKSFTIRLGRTTKLIRPSKTDVLRGRCDYLVRAIDGTNLLIIEVKAPDDQLDDDAAEQAISYARSLSENIAPFTIVTNSSEANIYDSFTKELLNGQTIPANHPHVLNHFRYSGDDFLLRSQALHSLISLSTENLLQFCKASVDYHMDLLRSTDLQSSKKYIPQLYVDRKQTLENFRAKLAARKHPVLLVTGQPQVGKTNFMCRQVEASLEAGMPCLFYPAIAMEGGLLDELQLDFQWTLGDASSPFHIAQKLDYILKRTGQELSIFIDGWNEADTQLAKSISEECKRLIRPNISFIISFTSTSAPRLLNDNRNNLSFVAEASGIKAGGVSLVEISPEEASKSANVLVVPSYSDEEMDRAYDLYSHHFTVVVSENHARSHDPFLLGIAMRFFQGKALPQNLAEPELLRQSIEQKARRAGKYDVESVQAMLTTLAGATFQSDAPVSCADARNLWRLPLSDPIPSELFEAALITRTRTTDNRPALGFYYERDRDFVTAEWLRGWPKRLRHDEILQELPLALLTRAGSDAARWFLQQTCYQACLVNAANRIGDFENPSARLLIVSSVTIAFTKGTQGEWLRKCMDAALRDIDSKVKIQGVKLLSLSLADNDDYEQLAEHISADKELIAGLLAVDEEYPLESGSAGQLILDTLREIHSHSALAQEASDITDVLRSLIHPSSQPWLISSAATALAYIEPQELLRCICTTVCKDPNQATLWDCSNYEIDKNLFVNAIATATHTLQEFYFGHMCPGYMRVLDDNPELKAEEFEKMTRICAPVIRLFGPETCKELITIVEILSEQNDP